ncbi:unnamed protein product [Rotaria sp. Silwood1]|nr:unnamed protein product [Rotaria sp. Silwood1]CAF1592003.1 unnamed protein product [Rotaria sp. Silwood1]CAF3722799.1 unnamed protein product [Rotaria sp. Silwood1]
MPEVGSCTDITCDNEIKELYQCHCCLRPVCLTHLIAHVEITKQNKQRFDSLRSELNAVINILKPIVEEKLLIIKGEQHLIEQAKTIFDASNSSMEEDHHVNEEQKKLERKSCRKISDECPLTFDGAYGLTQATHSIEFCEHDKTCQIGLYQHFIKKHKLKEVYAQRLMRAVADNKDSKTTKLFDGIENVIDHCYKVPGPFTNVLVN